MLAVDILFDAARGVLGALLMAELALAHAQSGEALDAESRQNTFTKMMEIALEIA